MGLTVAARPRQDVTVISVAGELDLSSAPELSDVTNRLIERGDRALVIDLSELTFCDSTGLTVLVRAKNRLDQRHGRLSLAAPTPVVRRVLDVSGLLGVLSTRPTVAEACADVTGGESPA